MLFLVTFTVKFQSVQFHGSSKHLSKQNVKLFDLGIHKFYVDFYGMPASFCNIPKELLLQQQSTWVF